jgi:hypothetical protein
LGDAEREKFKKLAAKVGSTLNSKFQPSNPKPGIYLV